VKARDPDCCVSSPMHADMSASGRSCPTSLCLFRPNLTRPLVDWSVEEVASWAALTPLPLEVAALLKDNAICGQVLETLTDEDMRAIGIEKFGWRRQLLILLKELQQQLQQQDGMHEDQEFQLCSERLSDSMKRRSLSSEPASERLPVFALPAEKDDQVKLTHSRASKFGDGANVNEEKATEPRGPQLAASGFLVDNSQFKSGLLGLEYHASPSLSDSTGFLAAWGSLVYGTACGNDWVKVGPRFLPSRLNGVPVLRQCLRQQQQQSCYSAQAARLPSRRRTGLSVMANASYSTPVYRSRGASHSPVRPRHAVVAGGYEATNKIVAAMIRSPILASRRI